MVENTDTWIGLHLLDSGTQLLSAYLDDYVVVLGRPWSGLHSLGIVDVSLPFVTHDPITTTLVTSSHQTELTGKAMFFDGVSEVSNKVDFSLRPGGTYRVTFTGLVGEKRTRAPLAISSSRFAYQTTP